MDLNTYNYIQGIQTQILLDKLQNEFYRKKYILQLKPVLPEGFEPRDILEAASNMDSEIRNLNLGQETKQIFSHENVQVPKPRDLISTNILNDKQNGKDNQNQQLGEDEQTKNRLESPTATKLKVLNEDLRQYPKAFSSPNTFSLLESQKIGIQSTQLNSCKPFQPKSLLNEKENSSLISQIPQIISKAQLSTLNLEPKKKVSLPLLGKYKINRKQLKLLSLQEIPDNDNMIYWLNLSQMRELARQNDSEAQKKARKQKNNSKISDKLYSFYSSVSQLFIDVTNIQISVFPPDDYLVPNIISSVVFVLATILFIIYGYIKFNKHKKQVESKDLNSQEYNLDPESCILQVIAILSSAFQFLSATFSVIFFLISKLRKQNQGCDGDNVDGVFLYAMLLTIFVGIFFLMKIIYEGAILKRLNDSENENQSKDNELQTLLFVSQSPQQYLKQRKKNGEYPKK